MTRHRHLRRRIERYLPPTESTVRDDLGDALDALGAWGSLEALTERRLAGALTYGPAVLRGYLPRTWAGVLLWHRPRGYYGWKTLGLLGIWALRHDDEAIEIVAGEKALIYSLPHYSPESYHYRIQREFKTFYADDGAPPATADLSERFDPAARLALRRAIASYLAAWAQRMDSPQ
jgi:hypothetical protein